MPEERRLIVFSRFPEPHRTKTRLIPLLGPYGAAALQRQMTQHTLHCAGILQSDHQVSVEIRFEGGDEERMRESFGREFSYRSQGTGDLGCRMARAVEDSYCHGARRTVIIGTDCPDVTPELVLTAFDHLNDAELVLGPATDGGYYLIGLRRPTAVLFSQIDWGTSRVLRETLVRASLLSLSVSQLETLSDVDRPEDMAIWQRALNRGA